MGKSKGNVTKKVNDNDRALYFHCRDVVRENTQFMREYAEALKTIRDFDLWRVEYPSWRAYVAAECGESERWIRELLCLANIKDQIDKECGTGIPLYIPDTESMTAQQARELSKLPEELRADAWERSRKTSGNGSTSIKYVKAAVESVRNSAEQLDGLTPSQQIELIDREERALIEKMEAEEREARAVRVYRCLLKAKTILQKNNSPSYLIDRVQHALDAVLVEYEIPSNE